MSVPKSHPRYLSLKTRDKLVEGWKKGLVATQGLIAHGRGEAFDYLIGERTTPEALIAIKTAAALMLLAKKPVISVNGNVGALCATEIAGLQESLGCTIEINIFHRTEERIDALVSHLEENGARNVLGRNPDRRISGLDHARALCCRQGIFESDVILVPLEDGDRCKALKKMGKEVITVDLNPLSRTAMTADVTIVDNLIRAIPALDREVKRTGSLPERSTVMRDIEKYDNEEILDRTLKRISDGFPSSTPKKIFTIPLI